MSEEYFIGVDVGTGSVRAALISKNGKTKSLANNTTQTFNPQEQFYEQSSNNVWLAVCCAVKVSLKIYLIKI